METFTSLSLYKPRKCSSSNRLVHAKDHASIHLAIADLDETGKINPDSCKYYAICGDIRKMGEGDDCINRLAKRDGLMTKEF